MKVKSLMGIIKKIVHIVTSREFIAYGIAGGLTTMVNLASYEGMYRLGLPNLTANAVAWVIAVTFAYYVNKKGVFLSGSDTLKDEAAKITKFFGARLITLGIEQMGLLIFVEWLGLYRLLVKAGLAVIVIILNYVFSKVFIFHKKKQ